MNWKERAQTVADEIVELIAKKQADYGQSDILDFGEFGVLIRANDKIARLKNLNEKQATVDESVEETWRDLAGYAIIALMLWRGTFTDSNKNKEEL